MKITKRQLKRIIKEEKQKLLVEMGPEPNANRALGLYANAGIVDQLTTSILDLLQNVELEAAEEEDLGPDEAEGLARNVTVLAVAQAFQSAGYVDVYMSLIRLLR